MNCPICERRRLYRRWETGKGNWWTGKYECPRCGIVKMSGIFPAEQRRKVLEWHPACQVCGLEPVVSVIEPENTFTCTDCGARLTVEKATLVRTWKRAKPAPRENEAQGINRPAMWDGIKEAACK